LLTATIKHHLVALPLSNLTREYPVHLTHLLNAERDLKPPREIHPVFYGSYDWHSAVHGYWLLARALSWELDATQHVAVTNLFELHFNAIAFERESEYFRDSGRNSFERPYGWAWLLLLAAELDNSDCTQARAWHAAMAPLTKEIRGRLIKYVTTLDYPIRAGTHGNTAFALILADEYAKTTNDSGVGGAIAATISRLFISDGEYYPARFEPGGEDFLSPTLTEAVAVSRILNDDEFEAWFKRFLPSGETIPGLMQPARVLDHADPKTSHLDGLNLSRAWCLETLAQRISKDIRLRDTLRSSAKLHVEAGLIHVASGAYEGEHWLATFAALALSTLSIK
jgi:hypothetical protein